MKKIIGLLIGMLLSLNVMADEWYDESTGFTWYYKISGDAATLTGCSPKEGKFPSLPSVLGGKTVKVIGGYAFCDCGGLTGLLSIPDSVTTIEELAFNKCSGLTGSLSIPKSVMTIGRSAFYGCSGFTGSLTIPDSVTMIGQQAFSDCSGFTGSLTIPSSVKIIERQTFSKCTGFTGPLTIPNSVTIIGDSAFYGCSGFTGSLTIPDSVTTIEVLAFAYCSGFTGSLKIPGSVMTIERGAFQFCSGFTGSLTIPDSVTNMGENIFGYCSGLSDLVFVKGLPPEGFITSGLWGKKISYLPKYGAVWQKLLRNNNGLIYDAGYIRPNAQSVSIVSSKIRDTDPTVMDVVYRVNSSQPTVKVRALAFKDGVRSFASVVRPETFIEGTAANIGDGIAANVEHKLSWKVSADWQETLAKVKFEVLALDGELLPLELTALPKTDSQPKMEVSWNVMFDSWVFDALMWLYADKDLGLTLKDGVLRNGDERIAEGEKMSGTGYSAIVYVYGKMGYELLQGERLEYARQMLRRNLPNVSVAQYAVKIIEE